MDSRKNHDGCDVRLVIEEGGACDVRLEVEILEEDPNHKTCLKCWGALLLRDNPTEYAEPPPPVTPCFAEPGTEARIQAMEERLCRTRCNVCGWVGPRPQARRCPHCGGRVTRAPLGLYHPDDCPLNPEDRGARDVTRGRNGSAIPGNIRDTTK